MKNIFKSILAVAALFVSIPGLHAQIAPDVYKEDPNHPGFVYSKEVEGPNSKGEYTIYLKSFMTGTITESEKRIPSEIILVLDVSGSMRFDMDGTTHDNYDASSTKTRMYALKQAVNQFITDIKTDATTNNVNNRIAIVKFAGDQYYTGSGQDSEVATGNHKYYVDNRGRTQWLNEGDQNFNSQYRYNATEIVKGFTSVTSGEQELKDAINGLVPGGATAVDFGVFKARALMRTLFTNPTSSTPTPKEVTNKMIVVFTDGQPNHESGFDDGVATTAISTMQPMKGWTAFNDEETGASGKIKVYTIGTFDSTTAEDPNIKKYMNRVSSNYPNATGMGDSQAGTGGKEGGDYYILATSAEDLVNAFGKISSDVASPAFIIKNNAASVVDIVAKSYAIPKEADASEVKVYTTPCTGYANNQYTFSRTISEWTPQDAAGIGLTVDKDNGVITVENFKFTDSDNIVALKTDGETYQGNQLIIEIPIVMNQSAVGGQAIQTNAPGSGLTYIDENDQEQTITFVTPTIHLPINLQIQKRGLNVGESAKFTIQRKWNGKAEDKPADIDANKWYDYTSVFVTRKNDSETGDNSPSVFIVGLDPNYLFKIKEEGWSWSYGISEVYGFNHVDGQDDPVRYKFEDTDDVTSDKINMNPFIFVNSQKDNMDYIVRHAESIVTNEFRTATSTAKAGETTNSKAQKP